MVTKKLDYVAKKWILGQKTAFLAQNSVFLLRYALITYFFGLKRTRLNGIITSSCPEVTLDTFGFPVGAHSAARQAFFWHRWPKMALFEPKMLFFGPSGHPDVQIATGLAQTRLPFWWSVLTVTKKWDAVQKNMDFGQKKLFFGPKINFFSNKSPELPEKLKLNQNPGSGTRYTCILSAYEISAKNM